ncbi:MAG: hypothetical protein V8R01_00195 [Bacilli bacterium]
MCNSEVWDMGRLSERRKLMLDMCGARMLFGEAISIKEIMEATGYKRASVSRVMWQMGNNNFSKQDREYLERKFGIIMFPLVKRHMKIGEITSRRKMLLKTCYNEGENKTQTEIARSIDYSRASVANTIKQIETGTLSVCDIKYIDELFADNVFEMLNSEIQIFDDSELEFQMMLASKLLSRISSFDKRSDLTTDNLREFYEIVISKSLSEYQRKITLGVRISQARDIERKAAFDVQTYNIVFNALDGITQIGGFSEIADQNLESEVKTRTFKIERKEN